MVAIALYRGNLHRVPNTPRRWPAPPRSISASQFKSLLRRRSVALSRLAPASDAAASPPDHEEKEEREERELLKEEKAGAKEEEEEEEEEGELADADPTLDTRKENDSDLPVKEEVSALPEAALPENEGRKKELEKKLEELNQKKHNLVQMLKQILSAEEEMKRRINQSTLTRGPVPVPSENGLDAPPSTSRPGPPRISVEVNFGADLGGESDPGSTQSAYNTRPFYQMQSPSPSGGSLSRSPFSHAPRGPQASSSLLGNPLTSPVRFLPPTVQHASSLPPLLPLLGSNLAASSSPSPAASGSVPSVFRDSRLGGGSS